MKARGRSHDSQVESAVAYPIQQFRRIAFAQCQRYLGVGFTKAQDDFRHKGMKRGRHGKADLQRAELAAGGAARVGTGPGGSFQRQAGIDQEHRTDLGQFNPAR